MAETRLSTARLVFVPAVITLAVTILRLVGEFEHWSTLFFNPAVGGPGLVGITWLAPAFGIYFAIRLAATGDGPRSSLGAIGFAVLGIAVVFISGYVSRLVFKEPPGFESRLLFGWTVATLAGLAPLAGWPRLWKVLAAYGLAARLPVVLIIFFALRGHWGTHYDAAPPDFPGMSLVASWIWLGLIPQLVFWMGFTLVSGMLFGTVSVTIVGLIRRPSQTT